ncbi:MAG: ferredoxin-thioredoxin reductase catalytic domain-containing protein [bacterium]
MSEIPRELVIATVKRLNDEAEASGYHLNPDMEMTESIVEGLLANDTKFGYMVCPCRFGIGDAAADRDIVCPCDYRDDDLDEFDVCYCGLYVSERVLKGEVQAESIPERRPAEPVQPKEADSHENELITSLPYPVWRCKVCGYLCARTNPPAVCPICKATKERFEKFM